MASAIMINHEEMETAATNLTDQWENMTDSIKNITNIINDIPSFWQAETADSYVSQYEDIKPNLDAAAQFIFDIAEQMKQISANFQETDSGMAGQM